MTKKVEKYHEKQLSKTEREIFELYQDQSLSKQSIAEAKSSAAKVLVNQLNSQDERIAQNAAKINANLNTNRLSQEELDKLSIEEIQLRIEKMLQIQMKKD